MNVWNKVLMSLTTVICVVFAIFAANKYQLVKTETLKYEVSAKQLADLKDANQKLRYEIYGDPAKTVESWTDQGLDSQLSYLRTLTGGELFTNCQAIDVAVDNTEMTSTVAFGIDPKYTAASFRVGAIVYLFDSGSRFVAETAPTDSADASDAAEESEEVVAVAPYAFLGAYKIAESTATQVKLESIGFASESELELISSVKTSGNSLVACVDRLPADSPADLAKFATEYPDLFNSFTPETQAVLARDAADASALSSAYDSESSDTTLDNLHALFGDELRAPVAYQSKIERQWSTRDAGNILMARNTLALNDLNKVVADQIVSMGDEASKGMEQGYQDVLASVKDFENWAEVYAAAKNNKKTDSYFEMIDSTTANLAKMDGYNKLIETLVAEADQNNVACQAEIDRLTAENSRLASEIARFQYAVYEKLQNSDKSETADSNVFAGI